MEKEYKMEKMDPIAKGDEAIDDEESGFDDMFS